MSDRRMVKSQVALDQKNRKTLFLVDKIAERFLTGLERINYSLIIATENFFIARKISFRTSNHSHGP